MYICTECSEKFKTKPEYCTCGNDEFKFIQDEEPQAQAAQEFTSQAQNQSQGQSQPTKPQNDIPVKNILSIAFFLMCVILSILIWFINPQKEQKHPSSQVQEKVNQEIPEFDKIWKDAPSIKTVKSEPQKTEVQEPVKKITTPKENQKKVTTPVQKQTEQPKATGAKPAQKPAPKASPKPSSNTKPAQQPKPSQPSDIKLPQSVIDKVKTPQQTQPPVTSSTSVPPVSKPVEKTAPTGNLTQTSSTKTEQPKPQPPKMNEKEFLNYKGSIRNALLANLNVTAIQGAGDCAVEFSIDNSGKLINRNFIYKSTNRTVNDEVYNMLMRLPYYKKPPVNYNGEKIKLKFMFNNGYYEISFM